MRQTLLYLVTIFLSLLSSSQQVNKELTELWNETKAEFSRKGEEAKKIATIAMDCKSAKPDMVAYVLANANRVIISSRENEKLNSLNFNHLSRFNDSLDAHIAILFNQLDNDKQFILLKSYATFKMLYDVAGKHVYAAKHRFNNLASKFKSPYFFSKADGRVPDVKF